MKNTCTAPPRRSKAPRRRFTLCSLFYRLPFWCVATYVFIVLTRQSPALTLVAFPGALAVGVMIFFPYIAIYYAVLAATHTLLEERKLRRSAQRHAKSLSATLLCALFAAASSVLLILFGELTYGWLPLIGVVSGLCGCFVCRAVRLYRSLVGSGAAE